MLLANATVSALLNVLVFAVLPFLGYWIYHRLRHGRGVGETLRRAGLQVGERRYLVPSVALAAVTVGFLILSPPRLEPFLRNGSPQREFVGLGLGWQSVAMSLLYGVLKTGFSEEFFFRGLIAGSLSRRLPLAWANLIQALIFLAPHLLVLHVMPELWWLLPLVFLTSLVLGWIRIKSGSILGPWMVHAAANVATCLSVAARTTT